MRRVIAILLISCTSCLALDVGFDFRASTGFVTDPIYATFASLGGTNYPTSATVNGQAIVFGWETIGASTQIRDRNSAGDPRLAGMNCQLNDGNTSVFRVDLPATGTYNIGIAAGDPGGFEQNDHVKIGSGASALFSIYANTGATSTVDFVDATGGVRSVSAWPGSNAMVQKAFGTTILRLTLGGTVDSAYSCIAHLRVTSVAPPLVRPGNRFFFIF